jgi:hypothetical protein
MKYSNLFRNQKKENMLKTIKQHRMGGKGRGSEIDGV